MKGSLIGVILPCGRGQGYKTAVTLRITAVHLTTTTNTDNR
jgi:hypothetical protein